MGRSWCESWWDGFGQIISRDVIRISINTISSLAYRHIQKNTHHHSLILFYPHLPAPTRLQLSTRFDYEDSRKSIPSSRVLFQLMTVSFSRAVLSSANQSVVRNQ